MSGVGYIKMYRSILDNPIVCKDSEVFAIWCYLLLEATHNEYETLFGNERIVVKKGQLITSRKSISNHFKINESKCERVFTLLKNEQMIEQQSSTKNRLFTILNWDKYQIGEQQNELQVNNNRTTSEQQVNTNNNYKNIKNDNNDKNNTLKNKDTVRFVKPNLDEIRDYILDDNLNVDANTFYDYYESNGWVVGKNKMKDWKATLRNWSRKNIQSKPKSSSGSRALDMLREMEEKNEY